MSPCAEYPPRISCPRAQCPPRHSTLVQTVPLSAECLPILVMLGRAHKGAMERTGQFEVSSIMESSRKTLYDKSISMAS